MEARTLSPGISKIVQYTSSLGNRFPLNLDDVDDLGPSGDLLSSFFLGMGPTFRRFHVFLPWASITVTGDMGVLWCEDCQIRVDFKHVPYGLDWKSSEYTRLVLTDTGSLEEKKTRTYMYIWTYL